MSVILIKRVVTKDHLSLVRILCTSGNKKLEKMQRETGVKEKTYTVEQLRARSIKVIRHFINEPHLKDLKRHIPSKYFLPKKRLSVRHLYLADKETAKHIVSRILPFLQQNKEQVVCETNAGLGLIAAELLENGIKLVRLYETCDEFRQVLKEFRNAYPNQVELFVKDIYHVHSLSFMDKFDGGGRVEQLLKGIPKRNWNDDPVMTIIGPMPNVNFINYLIKMLTLQQEMILYGRIQIFALMNPRDYTKCTADPSMSSHVYQTISILFQLFFHCELLEKYPRKSFLPWEMKLKNSSRLHSNSKVDIDCMYLVQINLKATLPIKISDLLYLYYFIKQGFHRGKPKVIPTVEKWLPGVGVNLIAPQEKYVLESFKHMNIYTEFNELSPTQILQIFLQMKEHPEYESSPFVALVGSHLLKSETIESDLVVNKTNRHVENLEENIS